jgi:adenine-specific DNA methylase
MATNTRTKQTQTPLENPAFPFEHLSDVAQLESWRKEVHRPIYHVHKWWAQRLGSVFRAILIGTFASTDDLAASFYGKTRLNGVVFDPFMGSGTTIGEALKLGLRAVGRDINSVAYSTVRAALNSYSRPEIEAEFAAIERDVAAPIKGYYQSRTANGSTTDVLYYFWVKIVACPGCRSDVDLFPSYLFVRNAYVKRKPLCRVLCPKCGDVSTVDYGKDTHTCPACSFTFNPMVGPASSGRTAKCSACGMESPIALRVKSHGGPPRHRMYAKLVLTAEGNKVYARTTEEDEQLYRSASEALAQRPNAYPVVSLADGYNTRQVLNYNYQYWHQMFNDRQLLCLSILAERIGKIERVELRQLFTVLFSGVLEFNNMFASFKGEGTGAVRHMFSHHILKPERTPLEANPWGTPKSSGSFSTLYQSRILRALDYAVDPYEVAANGHGRKIFGLSEPIGHRSTDTFAEFERDRSRLYLSCGDSSSTDLADQSVDAVVTDPPFFDNVHYSELADFFYVWQRHILDRQSTSPNTTRQSSEVQSGDPSTFAARLEGVFRECHRVLKDDGPLVFTYHHSRPDGWSAVLAAIMGAGFEVTAVQPIKSEMSVATPKSQTTTPIDLDMILVCRKARSQPEAVTSEAAALREGEAVVQDQIERFAQVGRRVGPGDARVMLVAQVVRFLSNGRSRSDSLRLLESLEQHIGSVAGRLAIVSRDLVAPRSSQLSFADLDE